MSVPNKAFDQALQKYLVSVRPTFTPSHPDEVLKVVRTYVETNRLHRSMDWAASGVSLNPEIAGAVWGCIKFIFTVVCNYSAYFNKITTVLKDVSRRLHFYQAYAVDLYKNSSRVQEALADAYGSILKFCFKVDCIFRDQVSRKQLSSFRIFLKSMSPWSSAQLDDIVTELDATRLILESEVQHDDRVETYYERRAAQLGREQMQQMIARQENRLWLLSQREKRWDTEAVKEEHKEAESHRRAFLKKISHASCEDKHEECCLKLHENSSSGQWLLNLPQYQEWKSGRAGFLWFYGKPGIGKTVLTSIVIQDLLRQSTDNAAAVAYFYCQHDQTAKTEPLKILGTILYQIVSRIPASRIQQLEDNKISLTTVMGLEKLIKMACEDFSRTYVVIDALDECANGGAQVTVLASLKRLHSSSRLHILILSRWTSQMDRMLRAIPSFDISDSGGILSDLREYVHRRVYSPAEDEPVVRISNPDLRQAIVDTLVERADGMFLWVDFQILHLCEQQTDHDIRSSLTQLPRGLDATYVRSLTSMSTLDERRRMRAKRALQWLVCTRTLISLELLQQCIAVDDMDDEWDPENVVTDPMALISDCANLVQITEADGRKFVHFVHASVKEFLTTARRNEELSLETRYFIFESIPNGHLSVFKTCLKCAQLFEKHVGQIPCAALIKYIRGTEYLWHLHHTDRVAELATLLGMYLQMFSMRMSPLNQRDENGEAVDTMNALHIAADLSCHRLVEYMIASYGFDVMQRDLLGRTPLHYAAGCPLTQFQFADASLRSTRFLLTKGADVHAADKHGCTPLHLVTRTWFSYDNEGAQLFMTLRSSDVDHLTGHVQAEADASGRYPREISPVTSVASFHVMGKHSAESNVRDTLLKIAQKAGVHVDDRYAMAHASIGHIRSVSRHLIELLLESGADPNKPDSLGQTPFRGIIRGGGGSGPWRMNIRPSGSGANVLTSEVLASTSVKIDKSAMGKLEAIIR
ncbi:uncharacterized protein EV420DRAFT_1647613 [Desarmillaria tabescens]|uniref:NACHT domain-containing protein n=1 Tax=Armillaria tabescens TaxID=1929756 RepID=A0AA39MUT3_ARMTA|nr:uncharacterized protein EV420DRAFT_1647613 [Desarmillaria tabescens]KAK0447871.1 hypothetical protein EV420DRAFT_1647613 [Desarmillaria tabescens]